MRTTVNLIRGFFPTSVALFLACVILAASGEIICGFEQVQSSVSSGIPGVIYVAVATPVLLSLLIWLNAMKFTKTQARMLCAFMFGAYAILLAGGIIMLTGGTYFDPQDPDNETIHVSEYLDEADKRIHDVYSDGCHLIDVARHPGSNGTSYVVTDTAGIGMWGYRLVDSPVGTTLIRRVTAPDGDYLYGPAGTQFVYDGGYSIVITEDAPIHELSFGLPIQRYAMHKDKNATFAEYYYTATMSVYTFMALCSTVPMFCLCIVLVLYSFGQFLRKRFLRTSKPLG